MDTLTGLDVLAREGFARLRGRSIGVLCNQAAVDREYRHLLDHLLPLHRSGFLRLVRVFGPEHGLWGHTQDNMIEWEGAPDPRLGVPVQSLYGQHRRPTPAMLDRIDLFVSDVFDVGSRYYTFVWTQALCQTACAELGIPFLVLDRPNPINGVLVEGPVLRAGLESFVGAYRVPTRHGLTSGEIARFVAGQEGIQTPQVAGPEGWDRELHGDETGAPWAVPSPNMPTVATAIVYPGGCLWEGTNLSEGRGTTRPFETVGAPWLDGWRLAEDLAAERLPGVVFRPIQFQPTFNKYAGQVCEGVFLHVTERRLFEPVLTGFAVIRAAIRQTGLRSTDHLPEETTFRAASAETQLDGFAWKRPPYEYESVRLPFDLLSGDPELRSLLEEPAPLRRLRERMAEGSEPFREFRRTIR